MGNDGEIFRLADGSVWEVKYEYEYLYEYYPDVVVCPSQGKIIVADKTLNVQPLSLAPSGRRAVTPSASLIESQIDADIAARAQIRNDRK